MRKPEPTRFTGRGKHKPDKLEMKGFSDPPSDKPAVDENRNPSKTSLPSKTPVLTELQSSEVSKSRTSGVPDLQTYVLRNFDQLRRLDVRLTWEQKRFLDDWEEDIRQTMPEGERGNPDHRRITKNAIIRVLVEIVRQLKITVDAQNFHNEGDFLNALFEALCKKITELRSSEVTD